MSTPTEQAFFARLKALGDQFAAGVPATLARLQAARERMQAGAPDPALADQLHRTLHSIAGSAGTFGFTLLGRQARTLEQSLRVLMACEPGVAEDWETWLAALDAYIAWGRRDPGAGDDADGAS